MPIFTLLFLLFAACTQKPEARVAPVEKTPGVTRVVFLGDSLTEGLGVTREEAFPSLVETLLKAKGKPIEAVNAGVSGSTSASAVSRMSWILKSHPKLVVLELGANDGLRGLPVDEMAKNLSQAIALAQAQGVKVLLAGMKMPPNYGADYTSRFERVFPGLSAKFGLPLVPFLLEGVGGDGALNQPDGIHPNAKGHRVIAGRLADQMEPLL